MMEPKPWETIIVPSVAMKGGSFALAIIMPLQKPKNRPEISTSTSARGTGQPQLVKAVPPMMAEHIITVPMDRSMPPVMITNVTPKAMKPM